MATKSKRTASDKKATPGTTGENQGRGDFATRFKPGQSGNPAGRTKGSRNKLTQAFINAMCEDFEEHGLSVIEETRKSKPEAYLAIIARIIPQQLEVGEAGAFADMSDDELEAFIADCNARIGYYKAH